jgi:nicotinamidase-related amidase
MDNPVPMVFERVPPLLEKDRCALVVVDLQEKLLPAIFERDRVLRNTKLLIECAKILKIPVLFTQQYPRGLGETVPAIREVLPPDLLPIDKTEFGCFNNPVFLETIKQLKPRRNTLLVAGIESHICVAQTALGGVQEGFKVHVASDATSSRSDFNWRIGLDRMKDAGGLLSSTEMIIYELLGRSDTPEFKAMLTHLK